MAKGRGVPDDPRKPAPGERPSGRARTAAAREAHSARGNPVIRVHDALVLPTIRRLRGEGLSWARIAGELDGLVDPPGCRGRYRPDRWHATAVWRIARRHGMRTFAATRGRDARGGARRGSMGDLCVHGTDLAAGGCLLCAIEARKRQGRRDRGET